VRNRPSFVVLFGPMTPETFAAALLGWHDFFLASAGATAALLGLLFVGVSINLGKIAAAERVDLRARAGQAFVNLVFVLVISLIMLIPDADPSSIAASLGLMAAFALYRVVQNLSTVYRERERLQHLRPTLRRIGWTVIADAVLAFTAWRIWESSGSAAVIGNLVIVVFVLLIGAADIAWEMLTEVSRDLDS
jgi:modulator of FtsH protease